jgi:FkbM family methyltransferase
MFYSQQKEDKILYEKYLNYKNGFFIELGAMDGIIYSNTLFFENNLKWTGILIEPNHQMFQNLILNRPNCHNFNYAISEVSGEVEFLGTGALGGMLHTMNEEHKNGWNLDKKNAYMVKSKPIKDLFSDIKIDRVDLFTIDVEGGEIEVLKTFNWSIPVYIICIEMAHHNNQEGIKKCDDCRDILRKNGFEFDFIIGVNEIWIKKENKRLNC